MAFTVAIVFAGAANAQQKSDVVAFTTSTQDSGLLGCLLPPARSLAARSQPLPTDESPRQ
jgi:ABC-type tungstate transport system permease subunit